MTVTTSSRKNYNHLALRGAGVDDMEFVDTLDLDPNVAYTPMINEVMLDLTMQQNIDAGMSKEAATKNRKQAAADIQKLLAKNGMLK